jgi:excisionase family DNA binding protein
MKFYTVKEVADLLKVDVTTIRRYLRAGHLKGIQIKKRGNWRIPEEELRRFLDDSSGREEV